MKQKTISIQSVQSQAGPGFAGRKSLRPAAGGKANFRPMARLLAVLVLLLTAAVQGGGGYPAHYNYARWKRQPRLLCGKHSNA